MKHVCFCVSRVPFVFHLWPPPPCVAAVIVPPDMSLTSLFSAGHFAPALPSSLLCTVCHNAMDDPTTSSCGCWMGCRQCVVSSLKPDTSTLFFDISGIGTSGTDGEDTKDAKRKTTVQASAHPPPCYACDACKASGDVELLPFVYAQKQVSLATVVCPKPLCAKRMIFGKQGKTLAHHLEVDCPAVEVTCDECGSSVPRGTKMKHDDEDCVHRWQTCVYCFQAVRGLARHCRDITDAERKHGRRCQGQHLCPSKCMLSDMVCPPSATTPTEKRRESKEMASAAAGVGTSYRVDETSKYLLFSKKQLEEHAIICPRRMVPCTICKKSVRACRMDEHLLAERDSHVLMALKSVTTLKRSFRSATKRRRLETFALREELNEMREAAGLPVFREEVDDQPSDSDDDNDDDTEGRPAARKQRT